MTKKLNKFLLASVVAGLLGVGSFLTPSQPASAQIVTPSAPTALPATPMIPTAAPAAGAPATPMVQPASPAPAATPAAPGAPAAPITAQTAGPANAGGPLLPVAAAAKPDPCSGVRLKPVTAGSTTAGQPGFPDEGFDVDPTPTADGPMKPVVVAEKSCENGRILIRVGALPHFGHRIGSISDVRILILADPAVFIDYSSLVKANALQYGPSDFVLALPENSPYKIRQMPQKDGRVLNIIDLRLHTFVNKEPGVVFNLDLRYATGFVPNTKTPDWKVLTTPDVLITRSATVDNGEELLEGNLQPMSARLSWLMWPVLVSGFFLTLLVPGLVLVNYLNRIRPGRKVPLNELAWRRFNKTIKDAVEHGWELRHYKQIAAGLRLGLGYQPHTRLEILDRIANDPAMSAKYERVKAVLTKLDAVMYDGYEMKTEEREALIRELPLIIDRPE